MNASTPFPRQKQFDTISEVSKAGKNFFLDGVKALWAVECTITSQVTREIDPFTGEPVSIFSRRQITEESKSVIYPLSPVTAKEVADLRMSGASCFVLKLNGQLYYASIPNYMGFIPASLLGGPHKCAAAGKECLRLSAASDEYGGCEKVRNLARFIDRYPWITNGFETFNTKHDCFVVGCCSHYKSIPRKKRSASDNYTTSVSPYLTQLMSGSTATTRKEKLRISF